MSIIEFHARLGNTAVYYIIAMALWGVWRWFRKQGIDSNYWGALLIGELLILIQGALGGYLWFTGLRPGRDIHLLYGIASALVIPAIYMYTRGDAQRRSMLLYGVSLLVLVGLLLRAIMTGLGT